jgi:hypothetical protein
MSPVVPLTVCPRSLAAAFTRVVDPRRAGSVTYSLAAMLRLTVVAILAQQLAVLAIAQWGARQPAERVRTRGFPSGRTPCQATLQRLFAKLDGQGLAEAVSAHFAPVAVPLPAVPGSQGVAIDGKAQHGRLPFRDGGCPVHALTAFCHEQGVVLAQEPIEQGVEKSEAELTVTPALVARVAWPGRVLTGDALFCQRQVCRQVCEAGGDYVVLVQENQPTLYEDIRLRFDPPPPLTPLPLMDRRETRTVVQGHGRQNDPRYLIASTDLTEYLDWPGLS